MDWRLAGDDGWVMIGYVLIINIYLFMLDKINSIFKQGYLYLFFYISYAIDYTSDSGSCSSDIILPVG